MVTKEDTAVATVAKATVPVARAKNLAIQRAMDLATARAKVTTDGRTACGLRPLHA